MKYRKPRETLFSSMVFVLFLILAITLLLVGPEKVLAQDLTPTETTEPPIEISPETPTPTPEQPATSSQDSFTSPQTYSLASTIYYVDISTGNDGNSCTSAAAPCQHIQETINKAANGDAIRVASGTYIFSVNPTPNVMIITKSLAISGGWDAGFSEQSGTTIIDGQNINNSVLSNATSVILDKFIIKNGKSQNGGGFYIVNGALTITNSSIINNYATSNGGGIFLNTGTLNIINTTISGNLAGISGGGIRAALNSGSIANIQNSTIAYNTAQNGGGISHIGGTYNFTNTILARNIGNASSPDCQGTIATANYSIIADTSGCAITTDGNNLNVDPQIESSLSIDSQVHPLITGSPAINGGDPNSENCPATDQLGHLRPQGEACDIGAVEFGEKTMYLVGGSSQTAYINTDFSEPLTLYLQDENLNPVNGIEVTFTAPESGASAVFAESGTNTTVATSDADGMLSTSILTANPSAGSYMVTASAEEYGSINFSLSNYHEAMDPNGRYVSPNGSDDGATTCNSSQAPCLTIKKAMDSAATGNIIYVAAGTYTGEAAYGEVVWINKNVNLSGGWDETFGTQNGMSTIDGEDLRRGITILSPISTTIDHFKIQNGFHLTQGGGIYNFGTLILNNSIVHDNLSRGTGGGIYSNGISTLNNTAVQFNKTGYPCCATGAGGAGIYATGGTFTLNNSTVNNNAGNSSGLSGSGINIASAATVAINNSTISGNSGGTGEGIYNTGSLTLNNSTISNSTSYGLKNSGGNVILQNTIIANSNSAHGDCYNGSSGTITSQGYNLIERASSCSFVAIAGDIAGTSASPIKAKLVALQNNGGNTSTHALLATSPAVNGGNPSTCLSTDQRGVSRPQAGICDIGAYEGHVTAVVSVLRSDPNPSNDMEADFTVTFSEAVTGLDITDFSLSTTGVSGASVTQVVGSGNIYTVTVKLGSGEGTIRLNLVDNDTILDTSGTPLGGTGTGNGNFSAGETYNVFNPLVSSITLMDANPTLATNVNFSVQFSEPVFNVDVADFAIYAVGVGETSIVSVTPVSADLYAVSVNMQTGTGNGSIKLNLMDNDTILDASNNPLAGSFADGQSYTIIRVPNLVSPAQIVVDTTPTFTWPKISGATKYQYQLFRGNTLIYTKTVSASTCSLSNCSNTPTTVLTTGNYKWRARAFMGGLWMNYSPYKTFTLSPGRAGYWSGAGMDFYITNIPVKVDEFSIYIIVNGCGNYMITHSSPISITNKQFKFGGNFYANGSFTSPIKAKGITGLNSYYISGCGYVSGGPFSWSSGWVNGNQPTLRAEKDANTMINIMPDLDLLIDPFIITTVVKP
jgi:hypothetical protein